ncbi:MAG TPA: histidine kinase dimerization/phospho-acceptor domain-containing protein [Verrucomicrobiae bacterium]|nr:histidine kinase dimerization/phospho-acceptor domain-containing protein [Verrucomicrobiae bacterium]
MADLVPAGSARFVDVTMRERVVLATHELRTPLNTILAWAQVLEQSLPAQSEPLIQRALAGIRDGVARQVALIEQLSELSRTPELGDGDGDGNGRTS